MHPYFHIFGLDIPAFGTMFAAAGIFAFLLLYITVRKTPLWEDAFNFFFFALAGAMGGAYLLYVALYLPAAISNWGALIEKYPLADALLLFTQSISGFIFYGGLIGGGLGIFAYSRMFKVPALRYLDVFAPIVPVAHAIGRVGCFLGGCCYGVQMPHSHFLSVVYPPESPFAPSGVPLLAVPLIEAALNIILAAFLFAMNGNINRSPRKRITGATTAVYLIGYSVIRFTLEFWRGDLIRGVWFGVSLSQFISAGVFLCGVCVLVLKSRHEAKPSDIKTDKP